jgi:carbohydrate-selective porin OprB
MDPLNRGILNVIESVIDNFFVREPNVNGIQQWINSCNQNNGSPVNRDSAIASVQGHSTPNCSITTRNNGSPVNRDPAIASVQGHSTHNAQLQPGYLQKNHL